MHKSNNLKSLFPCGDEMIVMIDDRSDVWQYSDALIKVNFKNYLEKILQVKPYRYFSEIGDINAPSTSYSTDQIKKNISNTINTEKTEGAEDDEPIVKRLKIDEKNDLEECSSSFKGNNLNKEMEISTVMDDDNSLEHVEKILIDIHKNFFEQYELNKQVL